MPTPDEYRNAGLYDAGEDAVGRLELLEWLSESGFSLEELVSANRHNGLATIASDRMLVPTDLLGRDESIDRSGLTPDRFDEISTAFGYVPLAISPDDEIGYTEEDLEAFAMLAAFEVMFSPEEALALVRVFGASLSRIAEASVSLFLSDVESRHIAARGTELELSMKAQEATATLSGLTTVFEPVLRRQVMQAIERTRRATIDSFERLVYRYAIGFVDLVGFTSVSGEMAGSELAGFLRDFEARAFDAVTKTGALVVKLIGDEVMFAATDPADACRAALELMDAFAGSGRHVLPRGGVAYGDVLVRGGDYYGSTVNLASRLADEAVPQEVLVSSSVVEAATDCAFLPAGRRKIRGFADPVPAWSIDA